MRRYEVERDLLSFAERSQCLDVRSLSSACCRRWPAHPKPRADTLESLCSLREESEIFVLRPGPEVYVWFIPNFKPP
eukprot:SAG22_NODE_6239_length_882_cov_0.877395_1_plen_77_part_00